MALKEEAGWNQTEADWLKLFESAPDGCFGINIGGGLAATTTAVCYGTDLAWIGMVLTAGRFRRMGLAKRLIEHTLEHLERKGVGCLKLDATNMGQPLYRSFGFEDECTIERWLRPGMVHYFPEQQQRIGTSFARGRPGTKAAYFGPCKADSPGTARKLLEWFLDRHSGEAVYWDLFPGNQNAAELAREHGFAPARKLVRMARPGYPGARCIPTDIAVTYAIAGFEWG